MKNETQFASRSFLTFVLLSIFPVLPLFSSAVSYFNVFIHFSLLVMWVWNDLTLLYSTLADICHLCYD